MSYVTLETAAQILCVDVKTVRRRISDGRLPAYRLGDRLIRVDADELQSLLVPIPTAVRRVKA